MEVQKFEYLENEKSFLDEIESIFHSFFKDYCLLRNEILIKNNRQKLTIDYYCIVPLQRKRCPGIGLTLI